MNTIEKTFTIFNYKNKVDTKKYKEDSSDGKTPWFYEPPNYNNTETYSIGFKTKKICFLVANIEECDVLIRIYRVKLKKINDFFDDIGKLDKRNLINKSTKIDRLKIDLTYASSCYIIKELDFKIKEVKDRRLLLKKKLIEIK